MRMIQQAMLGFGFSILFASAANAWGPEGHAIIADIAQTHLTSAASAGVSKLLALEGHSRLDDVSSWADDWRANGHPETGPWHFVDIPLTSSAYSEGRDCHYDQDDNTVAELTCIVAKLPAYEAILADDSKTDAERLEALKFVVHFVGDVHQPLHAENSNDRGGNEIHVMYYNKKTNLHAVWDGGVIEHQYGWTLGRDFSFDHAAVGAKAAEIDGLISKSNRSSWAPSGLTSDFGSTVTAWANESHGYASAAYDNLPDIQSGDWDTYQAYAWPVIEGRLEHAGARLAEVLNEALK